MSQTSEPKRLSGMGQLTSSALATEFTKRLNASGDHFRFIHIQGYKPKTVDSLLTAIIEENAGPSTLDDLKHLWKQILGDAITFLRINDSREWDPQRLGQRGTDEEMRSAKPFGVEELHKYFDEFSRFERILFGADTYYRSHVIHVVRVWILGALLLDDLLDSDSEEDRPVLDFATYLQKKVKEEKSRHSICIQRKSAVGDVDPIREIISRDEIQAMWCVIALAHDLGYPLQSIDKINDPTRKMLRQYGKVNLQEMSVNVPQEYHFINDFILKFMSSTVVWQPDDRYSLGDTLLRAPEERDKLRFLNHVQPKFYLKFSKSLTDYKHGIISSIILMKNLMYFLESDYDIDSRKPLTYEDARQSAIRREILRAIASHTCEEIYYIKPNTLSFLLIVCDELQCWGRPTFEEMEAGTIQGTGELVKFTHEHVEFILRLSGKDLKGLARHLFRRFHKILRTALDARERSFKFIVTVESQESPEDCKYTFRFENHGFSWHEKEKDWDIWKD